MKLKKPKAEFPDLTSEADLGFFSSKMIIGVDEVGRGCLAGSVIAAAAILCPEKIKAEGFKENGKRPGGRKKSLLFQVRDSKLVPEDEREVLAQFLSGFVVGFAIGEASVEEIERINIYHASHLAMERAVSGLEAKLGRTADVILVDGNRVPKAFSHKGVPLIKGDNRSISISAAALFAKVHRDGMMQELEKVYPGYGFSQHKGYATSFHREKILTLGVTPIHRKDFSGVRLEEEDLQDDLFPVFVDESIELVLDTKIED